MNKIVMYILLSFAVSLGASEIQWAKDYNDGVKAATEGSRPILFVSSNHNCKYCVILDNTTFHDKRVIEKLNKSFVSVISYSDEGDYLPEMLWRPGTPAIWFLMSNGEPMYQPLMGAIDPENFLKALQIVEEEFNKGTKKK